MIDVSTTTSNEVQIDVGTTIPATVDEAVVDTVAVPATVEATVPDTVAEVADNASTTVTADQPASSESAEDVKVTSSAGNAFLQQIYFITYGVAGVGIIKY